MESNTSAIPEEQSRKPPAAAVHPASTDVLLESNLPLTQEELRKLESMSRVGRAVTFRNKGSPGSWTVGIVEDEVYTIVGDYKHLIQRIHFSKGVSWDGSDHAYRTGYYTYEAGKKNIKWGQYTQLLTEAEYRVLLQKAKDKGWPIF